MIDAVGAVSHAVGCVDSNSLKSNDMPWVPWVPWVYRAHVRINKCVIRFREIFSHVREEIHTAPTAPTAYR